MKKQRIVHGLNARKDVCKQGWDIKSGTKIYNTTKNSILCQKKNIQHNLSGVFYFIFFKLGYLSGKTNMTSNWVILIKNHFYEQI